MTAVRRPGENYNSHSSTLENIRRFLRLYEETMKQILTGMIAAMAFLFAANAASADDRDFTTVNATGYPIKFLGVNPPGDENWNENELKSNLANGASIKIKFTGADKGCMWNVKVTWADDNTSSYFRNLNLCTIETVTLKYDKATDTASYTTN